MERWQMNRAGILNFWCYDDEELNFEEGRMILRGANGSGKSVTMQSLIPLVLDGDKRPERLDPFGSRDRRIEYYLIGEVEKGHTDRTGYLWLEFYHPVKKLYKTIGIGLRARRGISQIGFWGFLLEDGRRINRDFYLYDRPFLLETGKKLPLNRKQLDEAISTGGQVVQEQAAYREMVNKALFGFREADAYKDLLKLLLELRSPKLSKDFKPSSIYEILTRALPPLKNEELSSLTDVIEDMDQITDSLEELRLHIGALKEMEQAYDKYNRFLLYQHSAEVIKNIEMQAEYVTQLNLLKEEVKQSQERQRVIENELNQAKAEIVSVEAELGTIENSEEMNRQRELELLEREKENLDKRSKNLKVRLEINFDRQEKLNTKITEGENKLHLLVEEQKQVLEELDTHAEDMEFYAHNVYRLYLHQHPFPKNEDWLNGWLQDLENHRKKLTSTQQIAREEHEASKAKAEAEIRLGEVAAERGKIEKEQILESEKLDMMQQQLKEALIKWHQSIKTLHLDGDQLRQMLGSVTQISIDNRNYEAVRNLVTEVYQQQNQIYLKQLLGLGQQEKGLFERNESLDAEIQQWMSCKEPEPERTEARAFSRQQRNRGAGAPLYEVCEFMQELTEAERAQLEATLMQAGILDAWIVPGGKIEVLNVENGEETWIIPSPLLHEETLASILYPVSSAASGLSEQDIIAALNCFAWSKESFVREESTWGRNMALIGSEGRYLLGPLSGRSCQKERAEFIGAETRRKTKELKIARLQIEKENINRELNLLADEGNLIHQQIESLKAERACLPDDQALQKQLEILFAIKHQLNEKLYSERRAQEYFNQKLAVLRKIQTKMIQETKDWSYIKKEPRISEALDDCLYYKSLISGLRSAGVRYHESQQYLQERIEEQQRLTEAIEEDLEEKRLAEKQEIELTAQIAQLQKLMQDLGIEHIHQQIQLLKKKKREFNDVIEELNREDKHQALEVGRTEQKVETSLVQLQESRKDLDVVLRQWKTEWKLDLIPQWKDQSEELSDENTISKICKEMIQAYQNELQLMKRDKIIDDLLEAFNKNRLNLQEYAITKESNDSARIFITSKRDQMNPLTPMQLLRELTILEDEQQILLTDRDRALYEEIIIGSVGKAIRNRIHRARDWVHQMDLLMRQQNHSSGLRLSLKWVPLGRRTEDELDTELLVELLMKDAERMNEHELEQIITHFRTRILRAKQEAFEEQSTLSKYLYQFLDYRSWFEFRLEYRKGQQSGYAELTDSKFNALSGGEKATAMYIPLFAATYARYSDAGKDAPRIISLDEAFAGVDETNMRELFLFLTEMGFDYIMTSQFLWGCYDTVPQLAIYELYRPKDGEVITLFHYRWNGERRALVEPSYS